jgi:hypothetical protein
MNTLSRVVFVLVMALGAGAVSADGRWGRSQPDFDPGMLMARKGGYSLDEAVSGVRRRNPGKVLSADTVDENGRPVHRIRILNDQGRVRGYRFDGTTGQPLQHRDRPRGRQQR